MSGRETRQAIREIKIQSAPLSLSILRKRPAAWAAALIIAAAKYMADRTPQGVHGTIAGIVIFAAAAFIIIWSSRYRAKKGNDDRATS